MTNIQNWEKKLLAAPDVEERVAEIEAELRLAVGLTALREQVGLSQRELAKLIGVSQPRIVAIERARNVTIDVLEQYVGALGGRLELNVVQGDRVIALMGATPSNGQRGRRTTGSVRTSVRSSPSPSAGGK